MAKLIVIDGVDSSGKQTHTEMLAERLAKDGFDVKRLSFPDYESPSSSLVKMYLSGQFGDKPEDVNAYAASSFFAADRFASYRTKWKSDYSDENKIIIADRYVSSNMIHQASKLEGEEEKNKFLDWLSELEYGIYNIPKPDIIFFLDMPVECAQRLMRERKNKFSGEEQKDIHESNGEYLIKSYNNACHIAKTLGWHRIDCTNAGEIRKIQEINDELYRKVRGIIGR